MTSSSNDRAALTARVDAFLALRRIAVVGVSREGRSPANAIFAKLEQRGHDVIPVNPHMASYGDRTCYPDIASIPAGVEGVMIVTRPEITEAVVRQCPEAGVRCVWMHQSFKAAGTSVSPAAADFCREHGISVIAGGCPMMFVNPDFGHRAMRMLLSATGGLPT